MEEVRFTLLFVTHSIEEALIVGAGAAAVAASRAGEGRAELSSVHAGGCRWGRVPADVARIHDLLFPPAALPEGGVKDNHSGVHMSNLPPVRPGIPAQLPPLEDFTLAEPRRCSCGWENQAWLRKSLLLLVLIAVWEGAARWQNNDLMFPGFWQTFTALQEDIASGERPAGRGYRSVCC